MPENQEKERREPRTPAEVQARDLKEQRARQGKEAGKYQEPVPVINPENVHDLIARKVIPEPEADRLEREKAEAKAAEQAERVAEKAEAKEAQAPAAEKGGK